MQDIRSMVGGRIFGGGGGGGGGGLDRRMRPHTQHHSLQALKCPRCDSLNTKFCYYNNYNLAQPRHFCKSCRRYWTKGGVLRNVPVGGGCRKTKRTAKQKSTSESSGGGGGGAAAAASSRERKKSNSHSSSESSSLTANNTGGGGAAATEAVSAAVAPVSSSVHDSKLLSGNSNLVEQGVDCGIFSEIGSFSNLITSTNDQLMYGLSNNSNNFRMNEEEERQGKMIDETGQSNGNSIVGFGSLDWQGGGDQALFDQVYWTHHTQWTDQYQPSTLYFP